MKAVVTGGAGFIGSHITEALIKEKHEVIVIDNLETGSKNNLPKGTKFCNVDVEDFEKVNEIFKKEKPDVVFHLAAQINVRSSIDNPMKDAEVNMLGVISILEAMSRNGVKKIIFSSSAAVYGDPVFLPVSESHPLNPKSPYGLSKAGAEEYIKWYEKNKGIDYVILRYANVYGPRQGAKGEAGVIFLFASLLLQKKTPIIFGDGKQTRDFVFVDDVVSANLLAAKSQSKYKIFNIGTGTEITINELYEKLAWVSGFNPKPKKSPEVEGEIKRMVYDISLSYRELNWKPKVSLEKGLKSVVESLRAKK